jgi:hypothetical protein
MRGVDFRTAAREGGSQLSDQVPVSLFRSNVVRHSAIVLAMVAVLSFWLGRSSVDSPKAQGQAVMPQEHFFNSLLVTASADGKKIYLWRFDASQGSEGRDSQVLSGYKPHFIGQSEVPAPPH